MQKPLIQKVAPGRQFLGRLVPNSDIVSSLEAICHQAAIRMAGFSIRGSASSVTFGIYDQAQQVYVTHTETGSLEILQCSGNVTAMGDRCFVHAHILLCDESGRLCGGRLFSKTRVFAAEFELCEFIGDSLERGYDPQTGQHLWQ